MYLIHVHTPTPNCAYNCLTVFMQLYIWNLYTYTEFSRDKCREKEKGTRGNISCTVQAKCQDITNCDTVISDNFDIKSDNSE